MPRGKFVNHKGRSRRFTAPEELEQDQLESSEEETSSEEDGATGGASKPKTVLKKKVASASDTDSDEESEEDRDCKKGVAGLIEIENPNRAVKKATQKVEKLSLGEDDVKPEMSRRKREQIEKERARRRYEKLHAEGKTDQAKADLARLALIRQQREEAAAKRDAEKKAATTTDKP